MKVIIDVISYYCFNIRCTNSIFHLDTVKVIEIPLNADELVVPHNCPGCTKQLISLMDIELKKAFLDMDIAS